ncbi:MAG: MarC family NAAT transporter [Corticimicrobacter sp.]|uniref:MarC family NAAT transporter n=1 Tax=Corticimicrobacter sp. TaxID=2678536 RepID=UPI0032DA6E34
MLKDLTDLVSLTGLGLLLMLPLSNPLTSMIMFLSLSRFIPYKERQAQVRQATLYVFMIMIVTFFGGHLIMQSFGISIPGMRIAGGLIVAFIGFTMLFPSSNTDLPEAQKTNETAMASANVPNIAFVPLAMPGTAGPGTIAMIVSVAATINGSDTKEYADWVLMVSPVIVFVLLALLFWLCLSSAEKIVKFIGHNGVEAISRIMGFLLVCMAVQFVINGVQEIVTPTTAAPAAAF